jgi:hypothetical protein
MMVHNVASAYPEMDLSNVANHASLYVTVYVLPKLNAQSL